MRWTPAHALKLRRPAGTQCAAASPLVISEKSRNKEVLEMRDSYAIVAVMPRGEPTRGLAKLKRKWVADIAVRERFDGEPFGPLLESVRPRTPFTLPTHE
jgi:hypothetical protein